MTIEPASPPRPRRRSRAWACGGLLVAAGVLYVATAASAPRTSTYGRWDLEILRRWGATGILAPLPDLPDHLLKPGYIAYLRAIGGARPAYPVRRLCTVNALLAIAVFSLLAIALGKARRHRAAVVAAGFFLLYSPLRDCVDDLSSELPAAAGFVACLALLVLALERRPRLFPLIGALAAAVALVRPNVGELAVVIAAVVAWESSPGWRRPVLLAASFLAVTALAAAVGRARDVSLSPFSVEASTPLLWGAADYYWKPDVGPWPTGATTAEKSRAERRVARRIWETKLRRWSPDDRRALLWKLGHAVFAADQLPPRWQFHSYVTYDKAIRRWWWVAAILLFSGTAAVAVGGRGPWRLAPALVAAAVVLQGLVFGADPRFALPLIPAWFVVVLIALPETRMTRSAIASAAVAAAGCLALIAAAPDVTNSDYAVVRGPEPLSFTVPARAFSGVGERATLHVRFLELSQKFNRGLTIESGGRGIGAYAPEPARPYPPFVSAVVDGSLLENARRSGLSVDLRPGGPADGDFFYFPVVAPPWGEPATLRGNATLESGFGGTTSGGIPFWVHDGIESSVSPPVEAAARHTRSR